MSVENPPIIFTNPQIVPIAPQGSVVAFGSAVLNNSYAISNVAIHTRPGGGFRLLFHTARLQTGREIHCFYPITKYAGDTIDTAIIGAYEQLLRKCRR